MVNKAAQALGRLGGKKSSLAKTRAVAKNARLGGRPAQYLAESLETESGTLAVGARIRGVQRDGRRWMFQVSIDSGASWQRGYSDLKPKINSERAAGRSR